VSKLDFIGLVVLSLVIAWLWLHIFADIVAGPRRYSRQERERLRGWWYYDGWRWRKREGPGIDERS
jgi:hypothetical protein